MQLCNALPSSTLFSRFDAEFMPDAHITEFTREMEAVRMLIFRSIILCVMKPVPSFPLKPIANWTAIHRFWKAVRPRWPFEVCLDKKHSISRQWRRRTQFDKTYMEFHINAGNLPQYNTLVVADHINS